METLIKEFEADGNEKLRRQVQSAIEFFGLEKRINQCFLNFVLITNCSMDKIGG